MLSGQGEQASDTFHGIVHRNKASDTYDAAAYTLIFVPFHNVAWIC